MRSTETVIPTLVLLTCLFLYGETASAQTLRLRQAGTDNVRLAVQVGQTINIEVYADLQTTQAAGISFFVSVPDDAFQVLDKGLPGQVGTQPFSPGPLFQGAVTPTNVLVPESDPVVAQIPGQQLDYSAVLGIGSDRIRTGQGVVATFSLLCVKPIENGQIRLDDNPIRETKLFLSDGVSDKRFVTVQGMEISVTGIDLTDIPDVILLPGQSDSVQIGTLNDYIANTLSPVDSIRWTFEPSDPDSLTITIDPETKVVKVVPEDGWRGKVRIVWTATESRLLAGQIALSASEISDIVVNNPPRYNLPRGPDGAKRDTVRFVEDQHPFVPGAGSPDPSRAFRGPILDALVEDLDPDARFDYAALALGANGSANVRGDEDQSTHQLLVWSAPDFAGVDSFRVLVQDQYRAQDTLRVIVEVEEVPDAPSFIVPVSQREPRISRGSTKRYDYETFVQDVDTPLDSLILRWVNDPDDHFVVDTLRVAGRLGVEVTGDATYTGDGRVSFTVRDPADTTNLIDTMVLFFTSADALPPVVFPSEAKLDVAPAGGPDQEILDDFVEDPDNDDAELSWFVPSVTVSQISLDESRVMSVSAPAGFVGYEAVSLTVSDPSSQSDNLLLRIYSSDGRPVIGGIPDVVLDRGDQNQELDLDGYYYDLDNQDNQMLWRVLDTYDTANLQVGIDPLSHIVTYFAPDDAVFRTETVVFQVVDPGGVSAEDTVLVTIRSGGVDPGGDFDISPPLPPLQAAVGQLVQVLDLSNHLATSATVPDSTISWSVSRAGRLGTAITSARGIVSVLGDQSGLDTLEFVARDQIGRTKTASTVIRYVGAGESLELRSIPDIVFIATQAFEDLVLNDYVLDKETHPDSLMQWDFTDIGTGDASILLKIKDDSSVLAVSNDIAETQVIFVARNTTSGITGRDTVRVISQDPALAAKPLKALPPIIIQAGATDSSVVLNDYLPDDATPSKTNWSVSGQTMTLPIISPTAPHVLTLRSVGTTVGVDTLSFSVDMGGGFRATGDMVVTIIEPIDDSTLEMRVVPNPINGDYLDFYVMARTELASNPTVVASFEGDTTIAVRQIEDELEVRGVLIWAGSLRLRTRANGTVQFRAQALTALGSSVDASTSISVGTAAPGKLLALEHGGVRVEIGAGAVHRETRVALLSRPWSAGAEAGAAKPAADLGPELTPQMSVDLYPAGLALAETATIRLDLPGDTASQGDLYRRQEAKWEFVGASAGPISIAQFGQYAVMADEVSPEIATPALDAEGALRVPVSDGGSGIDGSGLWLRVGDQTLDGRREGPTALWAVPAGLWDQLGSATIQVGDRAGNVSTLDLADISLTHVSPAEVGLGANYPNPFNPETSIPFTVPSYHAQATVSLTVYNLTGQTIRELVAMPLPAGRHSASWDGRDAAGRQVGSGVYIYRLQVGGQIRTRQMLLLK